MIEPTEEERAWISKMERLLKQKPETIGLFGCESGLVALRNAEDGMLPTIGGGNSGASVDGSQILSTLTADCDGGAW